MLKINEIDAVGLRLRMAEEFNFIPQTGEFTWRVSRKGVQQGKVVGRMTHEGYREVRLDYGYHRVHRLVWLWVTGEYPYFPLDHINGDRGDNRFENLRVATVQDNTANRKISTRNTCGLKGVSQAPSGKWRAFICRDGKKRAIGSYDTKEEAHAAYCREAILHHGEFANNGVHSI